MSVIALKANKPFILRVVVSNTNDKKYCFKVRLGLPPEQKI